MPIIRRFTEYASKGDGSSAYSLTTNEGSPFRIVSVRAKFDSAPGSSELFTVSVDSKQESEINPDDVKEKEKPIKVSKIRGAMPKGWN